MIHYNCTDCGSTLAIPSSMAGQEDTCPTCGKTFLVPQRKGHKLIILGIAAAVVFLAVCASLPARRRASKDDAAFLAAERQAEASPDGPAGIAEIYAQYLLQYPDGRHSAQAEERRARRQREADELTLLQAQHEWDLTRQRVETVAAEEDLAQAIDLLVEYVDSHPGSPFRSQAAQRADGLREAQAGADFALALKQAEAAIAEGDYEQAINTWHAYLAANPYGENASFAREQVERLPTLWDDTDFAEALETARHNLAANEFAAADSACQLYLQSHPTSMHIYRILDIQDDIRLATAVLGAGLAMEKEGRAVPDVVEAYQAGVRAFAHNQWATQAKNRIVLLVADDPAWTEAFTEQLGRRFAEESFVRSDLLILESICRAGGPPAESFINELIRAGMAAEDVFLITTDLAGERELGRVFLSDRVAAELELQNAVPLLTTEMETAVVQRRVVARREAKVRRGKQEHMEDTTIEYYLERVEATGRMRLALGDRQLWVSEDMTVADDPFPAEFDVTWTLGGRVTNWSSNAKRDLENALRRAHPATSIPQLGRTGPELPPAGRFEREAVAAATDGLLGRTGSEAEHLRDFAEKYIMSDTLVRFLKGEPISPPE